MSANTPISVTAVSFTAQFDEIPRRIELDGVSYDLTNGYKRFTLKSEEGTTCFFDVSDGTHFFRLKQHLLEWRLISMSSVKA